MTKILFAKAKTTKTKRQISYTTKVRIVSVSWVCVGRVGGRIELISIS